MSASIDNNREEIEDFLTSLEDWTPTVCRIIEISGKISQEIWCCVSFYADSWWSGAILPQSCRLRVSWYKSVCVIRFPLSYSSSNCHLYLILYSKRLISLATQKFISDIANDSLQYCKIRQSSSKSRKVNTIIIRRFYFEVKFFITDLLPHIFIHLSTIRL